MPRRFSITSTSLRRCFRWAGAYLSLFLAALDNRVAFTCTSGAVASFHHKLAHGTGLEMSLIMPGVAKQFDFDDVVRCVAPRRLFVVSAKDDPASADAQEVVRRASAAFEDQNSAEYLEHICFSGAHDLDRQRFNAIVNWTIARCQEAG